MKIGDNQTQKVQEKGWLSENQKIQYCENMDAT